VIRPIPVGWQGLERSAKGAKCSFDAPLVELGLDRNLITVRDVKADRALGEAADGRVAPTASTRENRVCRLAVELAAV
jgi:hypothetical protein